VTNMGNGHVAQYRLCESKVPTPVYFYEQTCQIRIRCEFFRNGIAPVERVARLSGYMRSADKAVKDKLRIYKQ